MISSPAAPHHDGSPLYLDHPDPDLGDTVRVRVHVPYGPGATASADRIVLRSVVDGEPRLVAAVQESADRTGAWWVAELAVHNPVTRYRFLLLGGRFGYQWLNAAGLQPYDVTDVFDFQLLTDQRLPAWVPDAIGYQVFPDRFARTEVDAAVPSWAVPTGWDEPVVPAGPETPYQLYGGTLPGIVERLGHVTGLGVDLLYLTPTFPAHSNHRYDASSFDEVDPLLGGDRGFDDLVRACGRAGLRLIGDLTTNHTGDGHDWFRRARADVGSDERSYYTFTDAGSEPDGGGPDAAGLDYVAWLDVPSLPKLDHSSPRLRRRLYDGPGSVVARGLARGQSGWRIDVANMTGRLGRQDIAHAVARQIRETMRRIDPDAWLLAEHLHDASPDLTGSGWHGTMDSAGFTRPLAVWLTQGFTSRDADLPPHAGLVVDLPSLDGVAVGRTLREVHAAMPWASWSGSTCHLDSHDTPRFRTLVGGGKGLGKGADRIDRAGLGRARHLVGLAAQMTMPGVPMVFMGDEIGLTGINGEHARTPFPWADEADWDHETLQAYRTWIRLRRDHVALRRGSMRWVAQQPESLTFLREHPEQTLLVHLVRGDHRGESLPATGLAFDPGALTVLHGRAAHLDAGGLQLPTSGPSAHLYAVS